MSTFTTTWKPDDSQRAVIEARGGHHLVLAPPGCGKTQILTERISMAHSLGIDYADMLCLTFTNRAAREMIERINQYIGDATTQNLYVGNVHRYCARFLFENGLVAAGTSVIDDDDAISILAKFRNENEDEVLSNISLRHEYASIFQLSAFMHQIRQRHPKSLRIHPECFSSNDVAAMRLICEKTKTDFTPDVLIDVYDNSEVYVDIIQDATLDNGARQNVLALLRRMSLAKKYEIYKHSNDILDFEDLLLLAYYSLTDDTACRYRRYRWVQIDEVQDLNPLQLAIVDSLTAKEIDTVMYLGDEQQAIFSFMGAKVETLAMLKQRCRDNIHYLHINHRSPRYLLDVFNEYASKVLEIDSRLLPQTSNAPERTGGELRIIGSEQLSDEVGDVVDTVESLFNNNAEETTAVIVNSNVDADKISTELTTRGISHFKVSGADMFSSKEMKLLLAHFSVLTRDTDFMSWSRVMKGMRVFRQNDMARRFVRASIDNAISPADYIVYDGESTYVQKFVEAYDKSDIVVFDTETTGLSVFDDDIVQIAAVKIRGGEIVQDSQLSLFIATDRPIPTMLGNTPNPIIEQKKRHEWLSHADALRRFVDYADGCVLLAHNADFDYNILQNNVLRYASTIDFKGLFPTYFDSLRLMRLLEPKLKQYKLEKLLEQFALEGQNSHLADDDALAAVGVVRHCYDKAQGLIERQREFMHHKKVEEKIGLLRQNYSQLYFHSHDMLYKRERSDCTPAFVAEMKYIYQQMLKGGFIDKINKLDYAAAYISNDLITVESEPSLREQIDNHIVEMYTLKEADLCGSSAIDDRIFVTTIHKAKGLEFDNVIVFDAVEGRIPNFYSRDNDRRMKEEARKFYVAISRAKHRLYIAYSKTWVDIYKRPHSREITQFMKPLKKFFE